MAQPQPEKRSTRRFLLELPISVKSTNNAKTELTGQTRDVSSRGVFMHLTSEVMEGTELEFVMTLPSEVTLAEPIRVRCAGRVLRVEKTERRQGIAVSIDRYDFVAED